LRRLELGVAHVRGDLAAVVDAVQPLATAAIIRPTAEQVLTWLEEVSDPEIPVVSIIDLGIVREVFWRGDELVVAITPTYSGCPAMAVIEQQIGKALALRGLSKLRLEKRLAPAWTTDWLSAKGRLQLREYGIAPPAEKVIDIAGISRARRFLAREPRHPEPPHQPARGPTSP
jgi:ring-1,2-phenylacetyl-CoA epoxidase subunit PaaD